MKTKLFFFVLIIFTGLKIPAQAIVTIKTTSDISQWKPSRVTKSGGPLTWTATAPGMTDQVVTSNSAPTFDFSVPRTSQEVTITVTSSDGATGFTELGLDNLNITAIDASGATALTLLSCSSNQIAAIDISKNRKLTHFTCNFNQLSALDTSGNPELIMLSFNENKLVNIDLSQNTKLEILYAEGNDLSVLDVSNNLLLKTAACTNNQITGLDFSLNSQLVSVVCNQNKLQSLNIQNGNNTEITGFNALDNPDLICVQVDDVDYANTNWPDKIDPWTSFSINCSNPVAADDAYVTDENVQLNISAVNGILQNDSNPPGSNPLIARLQNDVNNGNLTLNDDGSFTYNPNADFSGTDTFTYRAFNGNTYSEPATVTITVNLVNSPPVAVDDVYNTDRDTQLDVAAGEGVLINDHDPDGDLLSARLVTDVSQGNLVFNADGSFVYNPNPGFYGEDFFTYTVNDGLEDSKRATVTIHVQAITRILIPNAFTPNNDGHNDVFKPEFLGMENVQFRVFDTWGNLIYTEEGAEIKGWDGRVNGVLAENGNYLYVIVARSVESEKIERKVLFTLIR